MPQRSNEGKPAPAAELRQIARQLYAEPRERFVAARNARAQQVEDRGFAAAVRRLPKPAASADALNQLVRTHPELIDELIGLGDELRQAQEQLDGPALRALGKERAGAVRSVLAAVRDAQPQATESTIREIESSLQAAIIDAGAGRALLTGCLVRPLVATGLEPADVDASVAVPLDPDSPLPTGNSAGRQARQPRTGSKGQEDVPVGASAKRRGSADDGAERAEKERAERAAKQRAEKERAERAAKAEAERRARAAKRRRELEATRADLQSRMQQLEAERDRLQRDLDEADAELHSLGDS